VGILKPSREIMRKVTEKEHPGITPEIRDSMAIPSFLHPNPLVRWLVWRRYEIIGSICNFQPGESVLEFGCGPGFFLPELSARGCRIMALDLFPQFAKDLCTVSGISATFPDSMQDIADGSLNTIVAAQVLEHIENPSEYYAEFRRLLATGGRLIVSLPTENLLYKAGRIFAGFMNKGDYHVSDLKALLGRAETAGFSIAGKSVIPSPLMPLYRIFEITVQEDA